MTQTQIGMDRLYNWALWSNKGITNIVMAHHYKRAVAVCGQYICPQCWESEIPEVIDTDDARAVDRFLLTIKRSDFAAVKHHFGVDGHPKIQGVPRRVIQAWAERVARELQERT